MQKLLLMKSRLSALALGLLFGATAQGQSLQVSSMDSVLYGNSFASGQLTGHVNLKNTSSTSKDYYARRAKVGTSAVVDSNYFCWDLCYPTWSSSSMGTVTIPAGGVANDFSGYIYLKAAGLVGRDTIWYTFTNAADASDTLQVAVAWELSTTFGQSELAALAAPVWMRDGKVYTQEQPWMDNVDGVVLVDAFGREAARWNGVTELLQGAVVPGRGWYTVRFESAGKTLRSERFLSL